MVIKVNEFRLYLSSFRYFFQAEKKLFNLNKEAKEKQKRRKWEGKIKE